MTSVIPGSDEFTAFMRAYQDMVFSTAARLCGNDSQAEDIAQEVFLRAYAHFETLRAASSAGGWLKTVTINLCLNYLSRYKKRWQLFADLHRSEDADAPEDAFEVPDTLLADLSAEERRRRIDDALRLLPEPLRVALVLFHFDELSYQDIAKRLHVSLAKVKTDIRRARQALIPLLQQIEAPS